MVSTAPLGTTGIQITRVGLGSWIFGGSDWERGWGAQDDRESIKAIHRAVERGVNWLDTAAVYGRGHAEEVVGRALRQLPEHERPLVFTKCGLVWSDDAPEAKCVLAPASIRRECDDSLRRLGVERIDLYQCHWPTEDGTPIEESWGTMAELVGEGKIRWIGLSNYDIAMLDACERIRHVDTLQPPFSLLMRETAADLLPWCVAHGTGVIAYSPLGWGLLTGAFSRERANALAPDDWRASSDRFQEPNLGRALALVERLKQVAVRHEVGMTHVAIAWIHSWLGVSGAIVGARNATQVDGWANAGSLALDDFDLDEIRSALEETGAGEGPVDPREAKERE